MNNKYNILEVTVTSLLIILIVLRAVLTEADTDIWGHVRFGQDILKLGFIPLHDSYSYLTGSAKWINHEWLSEVIFAWCYNLAGSLGLVILKSTLIILISSLLWITLLRNKLSLISAAVTMIIVEVMCTSMFGTIRPQLFTALFLSLQLLIIVSYTNDIFNKKQSFVLLLLLPLFLVWANIHGGFMMGITIISLWWTGTVLEAIWKKQWREIFSMWTFLLTPPLCALCTLINPYGIEQIQFLTKVNRIDRLLFLHGPFVNEWQPLFKISLVYGGYYILTVLTGCICLIYSRREKHLGLTIVWLMMTAMSFIVYRTLPLFCIGTVIIISPYLADCWNRFYKEVLVGKIYFYGTFTVAAVLLLFFSIVGILTQLSGVPGQLILKKPAPIKAISILKQLNQPANVLVEFNWAQYFIWHLGPQMKVAIDPRCETVYSDYNLFYLYVNFITCATHWDDIINKFPTDLVLISPNTNVGQLLSAKPNWLIIYRDPICCIYAKKGSKMQKLFMEVNQQNIPQPHNPNFFP